MKRFLNIFGLLLVTNVLFSYAHVQDPTYPALAIYIDGFFAGAWFILWLKYSQDSKAKIFTEMTQED